MRILAISGSPHGRESVTLQLVERVLAGAKAAGAETELIDLSKLDMDYCIACNACHITGKCSLGDDINDVAMKMLGADGLVLGSPVYFNSVSAQLKTLIDRLSEAIHCQLFLGKYACSVVTAGGPEFESTIEYMNDVLVRLGCNVVGGLGTAMAIPGAFDAAQGSAVELGRNLVSAFEDRRTYADQEPIHAAMYERFKRLIEVNKDTWPHEYDYWRDKGWL